MGSDFGAAAFSFLFAIPTFAAAARQGLQIAARVLRPRPRVPERAEASLPVRQPWCLRRAPVRWQGRRWL